MVEQRAQRGRRARRQRPGGGRAGGADILADQGQRGLHHAVIGARLLLRPQRLLLVGPSTEKQQLPVVPEDTVVIHGESDEVVPLSATLAWAQPQSLSVIVLPGVGHFFHGQLGWLKRVVTQQLQPRG